VLARYLLLTYEQHVDLLRVWAHRLPGTTLTASDVSKLAAEHQDIHKAVVRLSDLINYNAPDKVYHELVRLYALLHGASLP